VRTLLHHLRMLGMLTSNGQLAVSRSSGHDAVFVASRRYMRQPHHWSGR